MSRWPPSLNAAKRHIGELSMEQDQVVAFGDPRAGAEGQDLLAVEPA